jgi:hypothetical protein
LWLFSAFSSGSLTIRLFDMCLENCQQETVSNAKQGNGRFYDREMKSDDPSGLASCV